MPAALPLQQV